MIALRLGSELNCALTAALAPWHLRVKQSDDETLGASMPSTSVSARRISTTHDARVVVWLAEDPQGFALWVYDTKNDRTVARPVPTPPYDEPTAAALALSVKTAVRMVGVGPQASTEGDSPAGDPADQAFREQPPPDEVATVSEATDEGSTRTRGDTRVAKPESPSSPGEPADPRLCLYTALRRPADANWRWRFGGELRVAPWGAWPGGDTLLWTAVGLEWASAQSIETEQYQGEFDDIGGALALGLTQRVSAWAAVATSVSAGLEMGTLSGGRLGSPSSEYTRANPVLQLRTEGQLRFGLLAVYLQPGLVYWAARQRFEETNELVWETPRWSARLATGLVLAFR